MIPNVDSSYRTNYTSANATMLSEGGWKSVNGLGGYQFYIPSPPVNINGL